MSKFIVLSTTLIRRPHSKAQNQMTHFFISGNLPPYLTLYICFMLAEMTLIFMIRLFRWWQKRWNFVPISPEKKAQGEFFYVLVHEMFVWNIFDISTVETFEEKIKRFMKFKNSKHFLSTQNFSFNSWYLNFHFSIYFKAFPVMPLHCTHPMCFLWT